MRCELGFGRTVSRTDGVLMSVDPLSAQTALEEAGVAQFYPNFEGWFFGKVVPGIRIGERRVITCVSDGALVGIAITKRTETEKKLCTLWVAPQARNCGVAAELAAEAFMWLGSDKPLFTVPDEQLANFGGLLRSWSFSEPLPYRELYRPGHIEYVFNGRIDKMVH